MSTNHSEFSQRERSTGVLETARLILRKPTLADVKAIAVMANDRRVAENTRGLPHPYGEADAEAFIAAQAEGKETVFLIEQKRDRTTLGMAGIDWSHDDAPELGFWIGHRHWGNGFGGEAARAAIGHAFAVSAVPTIKSGARVSNPASRRIMESCGFRWTGVTLQRFRALGYSTPVDTFVLERGIWQSLRDLCGPPDMRDVA